MTLYVKATSSYKGDFTDSDIKKELKIKYRLDTRRQDAFIHLAVYGAQLLKEKIDIYSNDELYITSGVGNIDILQKTNKYVFEDKEFIKPFDFINMLGNTTSYYVANSLGLHDKNTFQISNKFTFINTLISVFASLSVSNKEAIVGAIDLCTQPNEVIKRVLGLDEKTLVTNSVNYQKFSLSPLNAIGKVEFDTNIYTLGEIKNILDEVEFEVIVSMRCKELKYVKEKKFFETTASYFINKALKDKKALFYVDCFDEKYKIIKISSLL